ncbi:MAG: asparagine synthase C-terminal domain-containing protein [Candidatus Thorarchaeota archaeon]
MSGLAERPEVQRNANPEQVLKSLQTHLENSFERLRQEDRCAVLFSGGVDSALAALMAKKYCEDTLLITARCVGSHDEYVAVSAADTMSLPLVEVPIDSDSLWEALPLVVNTIKSRKRMDVEIALPFFFAAREARKRGYNLIVSGQGPDELFAGYARYERFMIDHGPEKVESALWDDVSITEEANIQRDCRAVGYHGLIAFFPFLHEEFARTALTIPATLNIDPSKKPSRKLLFRKLAMLLGVPEKVVITPKRATQYSSGTSKMLEISLRNRVDSLRRLTKKELHPAIQEYLDSIG